MIQAVLKIFQFGQYTKETFPLYRSRLDTLFDMAYTYVDLVPMQLPDGVTKEQFKEALKSYILLRGASKEAYGALKNRLRENHGTKSGEYPTTMDEMISMMNDNYKKPNKTKNESRDSTPRTSNLQTNQVDGPATPTQQQAGESRSTPRSSTPAPRRSRGVFQG